MDWDVDVNKNNNELEYLAAYLNLEQNFLNHATYKMGLKMVREWWTLPSEVIEKGIKETPAIYNAGIKRIKNNKIKSVLGLDLTNYAVKKANCLKDYQFFR